MRKIFGLKYLEKKEAADRKTVGARQAAHCGMYYDTPGGTYDVGGRRVDEPPPPPPPPPPPTQAYIDGFTVNKWERTE